MIVPQFRQADPLHYAPARKLTSTTGTTAPPRQRQMELQVVSQKVSCAFLVPLASRLTVTAPR